MTTLKSVGFFREFPHGHASQGSLKAAVRPEAQPDEIALIAYLESGHLYIATPGVSHDVLAPSDDVIGCPNILTDGEWAWPEDIVYYVRSYHIALDKAFVEHARENRWRVPPDVDVTQLEMLPPG